MGKGKKPFIDRKNAVTFHLVHRSQHDPLVADETAPQRVLLEAKSKNKQNEEDESAIDDPEKRRTEQRKYGIRFDDDYNYLQHLKKPEQEVAWEFMENPNQARKRLDEGKVTTAQKLQLPSSVFASEFEEEEGMLNKAAPRPGPRLDWDPDVVAALDEDFDYDNAENVLEDDFVSKAMAGEGEDDEEFELNSDSYESDDESNNSVRCFNASDEDDEDVAELMDKLAPLMREKKWQYADADEDKTRFTEYSLSSSVMERNQQLTLLDDKFEKFYATYDEPEIGDLGVENIEGTLPDTHALVMKCFKEYKKPKKPEPYRKEWDKERIKKYEMVVEGAEDPDEELVELEVKDEKQKWDCESILSTYSNAYNHPKLIEEPRSRKQSAKSSTAAAQKIEIDAKTGLPTNVLRGGDSNQLTAKALSKLDNGMDSQATGAKSLCGKTVVSTLSVLSMRPADETPEEKKERKRLLKEYRNERRIERKANADAFKQEKKRQICIKLNNANNIQGKKIV